MSKQNGRNSSNGNGSQSRTAVLYARVSSKEQEDGFSIPAQQKLLRAYATEAGLNVTKEFTDVETAKHSGRPGFAEMLTFLKRSSCRTILVEKTDRLYRNIKDWVTLDELDLEVHLVKENTILSNDSKSHEKLVHGFKVLMAKNYVDNLSEEVKKGMTEKAEQGHWPSWAPIGYRNNPETHRIEPDPAEAPLIRFLFEEAAKGTTLAKIAELAYRKGLRSRRSRGKITREGIKRILANPIYWGPFKWKDRVYPGQHEPLIPKMLFDEANMTRTSLSKPRRNRNKFAFAGLVTCSCGRKLTGSVAKTRYRYYGCSARCGTPSIREADLSRLFLDHVKAIRIPEEWATSMMTAARSFETDRKREHAEELGRLHQRHKEIEAKIDAAYDDKLNGRISEEYWTRRTNDWQTELAELKADIASLEDRKFRSFETLESILSLARKASDLFVTQSFDEQARLIRLVETNATWDGVTLSAAYKKPFSFFAEGLKSSSGGADETRTPDLPCSCATLSRILAFFDHIQEIPCPLNPAPDSTSTDCPRRKSNAWPPA